MAIDNVNRRITIIDNAILSCQYGSISKMNNVIKWFDEPICLRALVVSTANIVSVLASPQTRSTLYAATQQSAMFYT